MTFLNDALKDELKENDELRDLALQRDIEIGELEARLDFWRFWCVVYALIAAFLYFN